MARDKYLFLVILWGITNLCQKIRKKFGLLELAVDWKAVAEKYAAEGWMVAASARRQEILNKIAENQNIFAYPLDVTQKEM